MESGVNLRMTDVDIHSGNNGTQFRDQSLLVLADDPHTHWIGLLFPDAPLHVDHSFRIKFLDMGALRCMDVNPPTAGDVTHNLITRNRITAFSVMDHDILNPC